MITKPNCYYKQSAVIPYKESKGKIEILLITSRSKKNWIIPKGIVEIGMSPDESASKEAYEEAGVKGLVGSTLIGIYDYEKWGGTCKVKVFPMLVEETLTKWPESDFRTRKWFPIKKAIKSVKKEKLSKILTEFKENYNLLKI